MTEIKEYINKGCFLILLLTLGAPVLTFAQEPLAVEDVNAMRLQAESDAKKDVGKVTKWLTPFAMGTGSAFAGVMCGIMTGCTVGWVSDAPNFACCAVAAAGSSLSFFLPLLKHYNSPPRPPIERLIGKHPEYVKIYTDVYGKKMRSKQLKAAAGGAAAGWGFIVGWPYIF